MNVAFRTATERDREVFDWETFWTTDGERRPFVLVVDGVLVLVTGKLEPQYIVGRVPGEAVRIMNSVVDFYGTFMNENTDWAGRLPADLDPRRRRAGPNEMWEEALALAHPDYPDLMPAQKAVMRMLEERREGATMRGILHAISAATTHTVESLVAKKLVERRGSRYRLVPPARLAFDVEGDVMAEDDRPVDQAGLDEGGRRR